MKASRHTNRSFIRFFQAVPALLAALLYGCGAFEPRPEPPPPGLWQAETEPEVVVPHSPPPDLAAVIELMERGRGDEAADHLREILETDPRTPGARGLLRQIDRDPRELLGPDSRDIVVQSGDTLAGLARTHLGNPLLFFALARYNDIAVPRELEIGRALRIPTSTVAPRHIVSEPEERVEPARRREVGRTEGTELDSAEKDTAAQAPVAVATHRFQQLLVEQYHDQALRALRDRRVDEAISLWEDLLAVDPDFQPALVYLGRAYELRQRLIELDESTAGD